MRLAMLLLILLAGCAGTISGLKIGQTQTDVAQELGPPHATWTKGDVTIWSYRKVSNEVGGSGGVIVGWTDCQETIVTFRDERLEAWRQRECKA